MPRPTSPRQLLADGYRDTLPGKAYFIVPDARTLEQVETRTLQVSQAGFRPHPTSPLTHIIIRFTVRVISAHTDFGKAEDELTDAVSDVCFATEQMPGATWIDADKIIHQNRYLAYDVTVEVSAKKKGTS
jgi:hypothetical protein